MKMKKRRYVWGVVVALLLFSVWVDTRIVRQEINTAYVPADADCVAGVDDFPALCRRLIETNAAISLEDALKLPLYKLVVDVRNTTGIRPTPWRWRIWLGRQFTVAHSGGVWGGCVRPGLLMRMASKFQPTPADAIFSWGSLSYGWRDGFLIFSTSRSYIAKSLADPPRALETANSPTEIRATFQGDGLQGLLRVKPDADFQVSGWLQPPRGVLPATTGPTASLSLVNAWPEIPLLSITSARWEYLRFVSDLRFLLLRYADPFMASVWYRGEEYLAGKWGVVQLPKNWSLSTQEFGLALYDIGLDGMLPVPELAFTLRQIASGKSNPLESLTHGGSVLPYEWEGKSGQIVPFLGDRWALCLACDDKDWLATSNQALMGNVLGKLKVGSPVQADLVLQLDWKRLGECAARMLNAAVEEELLMWKDKSDLDREWMPYMDGMKKLGTLELRVIRESERIQYEGYLSRSGKEGH